VAEQLKAISRGVQHMGEELSTVSETAKKRLSWLTNIKQRASGRASQDD
jgi:hypothetical protein